ncbi:hypothetical protein EDB84DRAFT_1635299 [Lactarius hengduanensis]|nr:hypothetical protein EDB84DRAFT_1635299 [Lactarius hengduanensis]
MPVSQHTSIRTVLEVHALLTAGQLGGESPACSEDQTQDLHQIPYQQCVPDVSKLYATSRRVLEHAEWIYLSGDSSNRPAGARMRQLRGSMERRWWIAVWRDCANDGVGIVALPMGRIIATTATVTQSYHFEDHPSTSYDVTSGQFAVTVSTVAHLDRRRTQCYAKHPPQILIPATSKTESRGGRAAYAAFAMAVRGAHPRSDQEATKGNTWLGHVVRRRADLSRGGVDWTIGVQNRNLSEWSWLPLLWSAIQSVQ